MRFIHLSDLHLGKSVLKEPMLEEQKDILQKIIAIVRESKPNGVFISGDIYDHAQPSGEAVTLYDTFITQLAAICPHIFIISGNHDSAERVSCFSKLLSRSGIHIAPLYDGTVTPIILEEGGEKVAVHMLPFVRPYVAKSLLGDDSIESQDTAVRAAIKAMDLPKDCRNVLLAHLFVSGGKVSEAEESYVGTVDAVGIDAFKDFDYVALGHIHGPQDVEGKKRVRYCGSPLKYSFSEVDHRKSVTVVDLAQDGSLTVSEVPLLPLHEWHDVTGSFEEVSSDAFQKEHPEYADSYLRINLTDTSEVPDGFRALRAVYHRLLTITYDNVRPEAEDLDAPASEDLAGKSLAEIFSDFFTARNGRELTAEERKVIEKIATEIQ